MRYGFARGSLLYYYVYNAQGDVIKILTSGGEMAAWYEYDAWGNMVSIGGDANIANLNPIRYRGYYYDAETGFYYLNSRYYDPEICRFINADGYVSTGSALFGYNMFAYCLNNSISNVDSSGSIPMRSTIVCDGSGTSSVSPKNNSKNPNIGIGAVYTIATTLSVVDGPAQIGDLVGIAVIAMTTLFVSTSSNVQSPSIAQDKSLSITKPPKLDYVVAFPVDPYSFNPRGLERHLYKNIGEGKNGGIIKWEIPGTGITVFEWNEDFKYGSHYHCLLPEWNNKHHNDHWQAGDIVPEPWQSLYF